ncbi:TRAP transporter small permease [Haloechinothrix sp. YIM 98757]|uniref:TRAP transporter small permease n=1 Tax=Haloechinothrix aidingensis TaxID=2752311 RepID=A0A838AC25_9PSEU|nr:TRAP transporter small permease [Haloechinothrix aidingensis]MBA0126783.1 TRAP transporter small permease [Haloechinothrix aidingensis]
MEATRGSWLGTIIHHVIRACAVIALMGLLLHTVAHVMLRYLFNSPITGTNEYVTYWYMPVAILLGVYFAQRSRSHIEARLLFDRVPYTNRTELELASLILTGAVCAGFAFYGLVASLDAFKLGLTGGMAGIVIWPVMFVVPLAFLLFVVQLVIDAVTVVRHRGHGGRSP